MCAEYVDEKTGLWACPGTKANHGWDRSVLNILAAEVAGVEFAKKDKTDQEITRPREKERKSGWIPPVKKNWIKG